ncbi:uncharacterized protein [Ranitomeya imitator]|uniref:uncharacterized protein n=1 Tax=Ranitomeya imitator TaxID=111125 RepID=UPI0037E887CA
MDCGAESPSPTPRSKPARGGSSSLPAKRVTRSGKAQNMVEPRKTQEGCKAPKAEARATAVPPPGGERSTRRGAAAPVPKDWGARAAREPVDSYASRVHAYLSEHEEAGKTLRRLREEMKEVRQAASRASRTEKSALTARISSLGICIEGMEARRAAILNNSGPFREKLENDDRFHNMAAAKEPEGSRRPTQVEEVDHEEMEEAPYPPGGLKPLGWEGDYGS